MRTIKKYIYQLDELHSDAREKAIENVREGIDPHIWNDEYKASLKAFSDEFGLNYDYSVGPFSPSSVSISTGQLEETIYNLEGVRAWAYIHNNTDLLCGTAKEYKLNGKARKSKILKYPFTYSGLTGFCADFDLIDGLIDYIKKGYNLGEAIENAADELCRAWVSDMESMYEDEQVAEHIEGNGIEFEEDGTIYR